MKICYFSASIVPSMSANSLQVMKMCDAFTEAGHTVTLYCRNSPFDYSNDYQFYDVKNFFRIRKIQYLQIRGLGNLFFVWQINQDVKRNPLPDIFYGREASSLLSILRLGRPVYWESHGLPSNNFRLSLVKKLLKNKYFHSLIAVNSLLKNEYLRLFPWLDEGKIKVIPNASNISQKKIRKDISQKYFQNNHFKVGYVGSIFPGKAMEIILPLAARLPKVDFYVMGGTQSEIDNWKEQSHQKNIIYLGFISHRDKSYYYQFFDVLIAPYQRKIGIYGGKSMESDWLSPLKIFEYMGQGKAIVASDLPSIREILDDQKDCLLCNPDDLTSWENALRKLMHNSELRHSFGKKIYQKFIQEYTWEKRVKKILE